MANADPFQQVVDEAAKQTAEPLADQHKPEPVQIEPPAATVTPPSNIQIVSEEPEPAPVTPPSSPTDANSLNSLIDALMDSSKPQAPPQAGNIIVGSPSAPPPPTPTIPGTPPPGTPPQGKKKSKTGLIIATILILLITLPIGIYFISQQRQLTEQRSKAAKPTCTGSYGTCKFACTTSEIESTAAICLNPELACCKTIPSTPTKAPIPVTCQGNCRTNTLRGCEMYNEVPSYGTCGSDYICCKPKPTTPPTQTIPTATKPAGCTFPPQNGVKCRGTGELTDFSNTSGIFNGICAFYHCPNGCGDPNENGPGKGAGCGEEDFDEGAWLEFGPCTSGKLGATECGQIDTVNQNKSYCIPQYGCDAKLQCGPSCVGGPTKPPSSTSTPTKTPTATATSTVAPTATGTIQPTATGTTAPTATGTTAPTATETSQPTATTTTIASCSQSCGADSDCDSGLVCYTGMCRKPECLDEEDCSCPVAIEDTPVPETPITGVPSVAGIVSALGGILLIIIGLLL